YCKDVQTYRYDPAIEQFDTMPIVNADLVINTDVLEHIPVADVDDVLADIRRLSTCAIFCIATAPAKCILGNGQNAHCTVRPGHWWGHRLHDHFDHVVSLRAPGRKRCMFKTWPSQPEKWLVKRYWNVRLKVQQRLGKSLTCRDSSTNRAA
ncbi:MAG: hypothetical protein O7G86_12830, partial [Gammaproteobacteria bacterium]|nr:hypothetical protein [Gammaproteobacteria bacterium]